MEIKSTLQKPYTEEQRVNFIVSENHNKGYEIRETETALEAWGKTTEEIEAEAKQQRVAELQAELDKIDLKSIRSQRAIQAGTGTEEDIAKLAELEAQAEEIRQQIREIINTPQEQTDEAQPEETI